MFKKFDLILVVVLLLMLCIFTSCAGRQIIQDPIQEVIEIIEKKDPVPVEKIELRIISRYYMVQTWKLHRDCLWNIAKKKEVYGDPFEWKRLYEDNKEMIGDNPDLIYPGQVLRYNLKLH